ncbi:MAG: disulfide bond formation protein B [Candidatus Liptonbacteria bacterium]|nr:disulfide bond formation protein B [Candidatus Liptonbacteria bacterium]
MSPLVQSVTNLLSLGTIFLNILTAALLILLIVPAEREKWYAAISRFIGKNEILLSLFVATTAVAGSLFYSEIANFAPCELCWIQRAILYTQAVIFFVAIVAWRDEHVRKYRMFVRKFGIFLSAIGIPIAAYHTYLQFGGFSFIPCPATGPSCQFVYFVEYGYVTIPTMSLTAFILILVLCLFPWKNRD